MNEKRQRKGQGIANTGGKRGGEKEGRNRDERYSRERGERTREEIGGETYEYRWREGDKGEETEG
jgi:hypothetical protein